LDTVIKSCLEGEEGAWEMLVNLYSKRIFNLAYQFAGSYQESEDLTQEIFLKLYHALHKYDFEKNFSAWLLTLAKNHLIDHYRKTKWEKTKRDDFEEYFLASPNAENPEREIIRQEKKKIIWDGLNLISSDIRIAIILRDIQGKSYEEIVEIMELPLGTIKSRINRGRIQLANILKERKERENEM